MAENKQFAEMLLKFEQPKTAEEARELSRALRSAAERLKRKSAELEEKEEAERAARRRAMQLELKKRFAEFVIERVLTDAAALSLFESYGEALKASVAKSAQKIEAAERERDVMTGDDRRRAQSAINEIAKDHIFDSELAELYDELNMGVVLGKS